MRRRRWWVVYLVLLALSQGAQALWPRRPAPGPDQQVTAVPRHTAHGPAGGNPVRIAWRERAAGSDGAADGETVIYLHGVPGSGRDAARLAGHVAPRFRFLAPDLPGFGASTRDLPDYGVAAQARYLLAWMDAVGVERAHLVAHSMGAGVAIQAADLAPRRVASIAAYGGIGVQEGEGSGDYYLEHLKYAAGYALLVALPEALPHFGLLGPRSSRHAMIRCFMDTDQRPLRAMLERLEPPLLLVHGRRDPLVPLRAAEEHHRLAARSEFVVLEGSHFLVFGESGASRLAREIVPFLERHARPDPGAPAGAALADPAEAVKPPPRGADLARIAGLGPWAQVAAVAAATFVSEDWVCISAGLLARDGKIDFFVACLGCVVGILVGDIGLVFLGRVVGRRVLGWSFVSRRLGPESVERFGAGLDRHLGRVVFASRVLPGTRLATWVAAGTLSRRPLALAAWLLLGALVWAPLLVLAALLLGPLAAAPFAALFGRGWWAWVGAAVMLLAALRLGLQVSTADGRARAATTLSRLWRFEFWPAWLFYLPLVPSILYFALRHRGLTVPTAANPGIPHGGFVGESKFAILSRLPEAAIVPSAPCPPGDPAARRDALLAHAAARGWSLPLVLKPDEGQRGAGLKVARDAEDILRYLRAEPRAVLAQPLDPGPHEAGVFYYRLPGAPAGRIFSITEKRFPVVIGDGVSTLERLIRADARLRMQAGVFLRRHARRRGEVPARGACVALAVSGNHCQGTMFLDGARLITPELERAVDAIARAFDGFYFGRFDLRYSDPADLAAGRGLRIVELNGVMSESTDIYDPRRGLVSAYVTLHRQWALAFRIGAANRALGHRVSSVAELARALLRHYRGRRADPIAD